jgi:hypothetical protein
VTAAGEAATGTGKAAVAAKKYTTAASAAAGAARGQRNALIDLSRALQAQFSPVIALIQAEKEFKTKQDAAAAAVKNHGRNSKEARAASLDLAAAALDLTGKVGCAGRQLQRETVPRDADGPAQRRTDRAADRRRGPLVPHSEKR